MIRPLEPPDLPAVMQIWLDTNINAHPFIPKEYWQAHYASVKEMLPQAQVYVYEDDSLHQILGFIGLTDYYIAGIFIKETAQSNGIGKQLLNYAKETKSALCLRVYQKNKRAVSFYQREQFMIQSEDIDENTKEKEFRMCWSQ